MPQACIFVANLDSTKTDNELFEKVWQHFVQWGELSEVKMDRDTANRPFAFVQFKNIAEAKRALLEAQGDSIDGREIRIEPAKVIRTLRVKYNPNWNPRDVKTHFSKFGHIEDFKLLRFPDTMDLKGVAFIKYFSRADAIQAFLKTRKIPKWYIEWVKNPSRHHEVDKRSLFVGKLNPERVTEDLLRFKFEKYGEIETLRLYNPSATLDALLEPRSAFAFIQYTNDHDAELAIDETHGSRWLERIIKVQYRELHAADSNHQRFNSTSSTASVSQQQQQRNLSDLMGQLAIGRSIGASVGSSRPLNPYAPEFGQQQQSYVITPPPQYQPWMQQHARPTFFQSPTQPQSAVQYRDPVRIDRNFYPGVPYGAIPVQSPYHQPPPGWQIIMVPVQALQGAQLPPAPRAVDPSIGYGNFASQFDGYDEKEF
ncbi:hypothetical protein HDU98_011011 [Podochytrium sp. JEL0797]|nr:hypothetical protein HDU98_011011 [Podochytrium sp. JEL0797]